MTSSSLSWQIWDTHKQRHKQRKGEGMQPARVSPQPTSSSQPAGLPYHASWLDSRWVMRDVYMRAKHNFINREQHTHAHAPQSLSLSSAAAAGRRAIALLPMKGHMVQPTLFKPAMSSVKRTKHVAATVCLIIFIFYCKFFFLGTLAFFRNGYCYCFTGKHRIAPSQCDAIIEITQRAVNVQVNNRCFFFFHDRVRPPASFYFLYFYLVHNFLLISRVWRNIKKYQQMVQ